MTDDSILRQVANAASAEDFLDARRAAREAVAESDRAQEEAAAQTRDARGREVVPAHELNAMTADQLADLAQRDPALYERTIAHHAATPVDESAVARDQFGQAQPGSAA